jgi:serine/threonine protein kinase/WD40 repeat protein
MPDPNAPNEHTRKSPPRPEASADRARPELAVPARVGRFVVKAVLGTGTYGRVLLALDSEMGRQVAIKQPFGEGLKPEYRADFLKEARAAAVIDQHANVCPVYHIDTDGGLPYIVMRFVPGGTLKAIMERRGAFPAREAAAVAAQIARGLVAAHAKGVIHRDLKPANVLFDPGNGTYLLTDFGLARLASNPATATLGRGAHGTPFYMPPEQWGSREFGPVTPLADVYSLGVILYEMLVGEPPFSGGPFELMTQHCTDDPIPPSIHRPQIDPRIEALCLKALKKRPAERFRSAREFAEEFEAYSDGALPMGEEISPLAPPPPQKPPKPKPPAAGASTRPLPDATIVSKEVVRCPKCRARLEIPLGRTQPVKCPMCEITFAVEAGRRAEARASQPDAVLIDEPEAPPEPAPKPKAKPKAKPKKPAPEPNPEREERPRSRKLYGCLFVLALLGAAGGAVAVYWDDIELWSRQYRPKPVEFQPLATVQPGADQTRAFALVPLETGKYLLLTNSDDRDALAVGWDESGRKAHTFRKPVGTDLDATRLRFRASSTELVAFGRDAADKAHVSLWVYPLRERDEPDAVSPRAVSLPRHIWDVNADRSRALLPPGEKSVALLNLNGGGTQATLSAGGPKIRAIAFAPNGESVVGLCDESQLRVWNALTGSQVGNPVRLAVRPDWGLGEVGKLSFDPEFTHVTVTTESRVGVWDLRTGAVIQPMKPRAAGEPMRDKYRVRKETAGPGTFSVFHDDFRLRAGKLEVPEGGEVSSWAVSADGTTMAASVRRKVFVWRAKYAP